MRELQPSLSLMRRTIVLQTERLQSHLLVAQVCCVSVYTKRRGDLVDDAREAHHSSAAVDDLGKLVLGAVCGGGDGEGVEAKVARLAGRVREHVSRRDHEPGV